MALVDSGEAIASNKAEAMMVLMMTRMKKTKKKRIVEERVRKGKEVHRGMGEISNGDSKGREKGRSKGKTVSNGGS